MANQVSPEDIKHVIKQTGKLQQLAKEGIVEANKEAEQFSLSAKENIELSQFAKYGKYQNEIADLQRMKFGTNDPASVGRNIDVYKKKLSQLQVTYDAKRAKELRAKSARRQGQYDKTLKRYFSKNIKRNWEQLNLFLYARKQALGLLDYKIVNQIQDLLNVEKCRFASDQQFEDVTLKLQKIRARLVVERQHKPATQKPAGKGWNNAPSKGSRIGAWLWKLYEKSLKVIVDAFLERVWPKG